MGLHFRPAVGNPRVDCPCPKEPCRFVDMEKAHPKCRVHNLTHASMVGHAPEHCPARRRG